MERFHELHFLSVDLNVCFTFARVVETEISLGEWQGAKRGLEKAERGYAVIRRLLSKLGNIEQQAEVLVKSDRLRKRLDDLHQKLKAPPLRPAPLHDPTNQP